METNKLKKEDAVKIITSRSLVPDVDGYYQLKVTSVVPFEGRYIIGLAGMTNYHLTEAKRLLKENKTDEAANQNLSASVRMTDYIPSKGEYIKVYIQELTTKNGVTGRFVTSITELKSGVTHKITLDLEDLEVETIILEANAKELVK